MVVIADTSPINYLILIGADHVLPELYKWVVVPSAVVRELQHEDAPASVRQWIASPPAWLRIELVSDRVDPALDSLGAGEREAIILAEDTSDVLLLMDEAKGRAEATRRGLVSTGTLAVLDTAATVGLLDLPDAIERLRATNFRVAPQLLKRLLDQYAVRRT